MTYVGNRDDDAEFISSVEKHLAGIKNELSRFKREKGFIKDQDSLTNAVEFVRSNIPWHNVQVPNRESAGSNNSSPEIRIIQKHLAMINAKVKEANILAAKAVENVKHDQ